MWPYDQWTRPQMSPTRWSCAAPSLSGLGCCEIDWTTLPSGTRIRHIQAGAGEASLAFQSPRDQYLHIARRGQDNSPAQVAAWAFGFAEGSFRLRVPTDRPARLNWAGGSVHSVVAVVPRTDGAPEDERVIFIDLRGLGHWPQWTTVEGQYFHPGRYVEALQIDVVDEFSVVVQGGRRHGSGLASSSIHVLLWSNASRVIALRGKRSRSNRSQSVGQGCTRVVQLVGIFGRASVSLVRSKDGTGRAAASLSRTGCCRSALGRFGNAGIGRRVGDRLLARFG
eukprot:s6819_g3.t1